MSKEYYRQMIASKREQIERAKGEIERARTLKGQSIDQINRQIENSSSSTAKANYRASKIRTKEQYDRQIDGIKQRIERMRDEISRYREQASRA